MDEAKSGNKVRPKSLSRTEDPFYFQTDPDTNQALIRNEDPTFFSTDPDPAQLKT